MSNSNILKELDVSSMHFKSVHSVSNEPAQHKDLRLSINLAEGELDTPKFSQNTSPKNYLEKENKTKNPKKPEKNKMEESEGKNEGSKFLFFGQELNPEDAFVDKIEGNPFLKKEKENEKLFRVFSFGEQFRRDSENSKGSPNFSSNLAGEPFPEKENQIRTNTFDVLLGKSFDFTTKIQDDLSISGIDAFQDQKSHFKDEVHFTELISPLSSTLLQNQKDLSGDYEVIFEIDDGHKSDSEPNDQKSQKEMPVVSFKDNDRFEEVLQN